MKGTVHCWQLIKRRFNLTSRLTLPGSGTAFHSAAYCSLRGVGCAACYSQPWVTVEAVGKSLCPSPLPPAGTIRDVRRREGWFRVVPARSPRVPPLPPQLPFPSRLAHGTGKGREVYGPSWDGLFLLFALLQPLMSGHDSSLLIKGFLCQVNQAELGGKLLKDGLTLGSRGQGWGSRGSTEGCGIQP